MYEKMPSRSFFLFTLQLFLQSSRLTDKQNNKTSGLPRAPKKTTKEQTTKEQ